VEPSPLNETPTTTSNLQLGSAPRDLVHFSTQTYANTKPSNMASVRTFTLPHYEAFPVHVALFKDVKNASFLRRQLLEANPDYDYAFLDASMVGHGSPPVHCFSCI
jgi:hypothetical protein